jgi:pyruvate,water dikinase
MIAGLRSEGIRVPNGFATTAAAYREFLGTDDLEGKIRI